MKKYLKTAIVLLIGGALAYWFIARTDWSVVGEKIRHVNGWALFASLILINLTMVARGFRWQVLLAPIAPVSVRNAFAATAIGFGAIFVIGRAGEVVRPIALSLRERLRPSATLATLLIERIFDTAAVVGLFSFNLLFFQMPQQTAEARQTLALLRTTGALLSFGVIVGVGVLIFLRWRAEVLLQWLETRTAALPPKLMRPLLNLLRSLAEGLAVLTGARALLLAVFYSACVWALVTAATWLVAYAFGLHLPITYAVFVLGFGLVGSIVPTPGGGAGAFHAAAAKGLEFLGIETNLAAAIAVVYHLIAFGAPFILGLYYLIRDDISVQQIRDSLNEEMHEEITTHDS
ncbi:MAG: flippase-like domain-containing protein [Acidobacteria bacterium]|nr:flippase-like domain-containing protein [Acidobacteriota bacterium]